MNRSTVHGTYPAERHDRLLVYLHFRQFHAAGADGDPRDEHEFRGAVVKHPQKRELDLFLAQARLDSSDTAFAFCGDDNFVGALVKIVVGALVAVQNPAGEMVTQRR